MEELSNAVMEDIRAGAESLVPECTTSELSLDLSAFIPLHRPIIGIYADGEVNDLPPEFKTSWTDVKQDTGVGTPSPSKRSHPQATVRSIISIDDLRTRQIVQRAASRGIVAAIEAVDGFKYSFNNAWGAKDEDGQRFSYVCQDSMQNKDRHANGFTRTQKHLKGEGERGARKPTYDCKGSISVKCSSSRKSLEVYYRHYAIHPKLVERRVMYQAGPPQQLRGIDADDGALNDDDDDEMDSTGLFGKLQAEKTAFTSPPAMQAPSLLHQSETSNVGKPLKRKRSSDAPLQSVQPAHPLSLVELLKQSESAQASSAAPPTTPKTKANVHPAPLQYELPSWQKPPANPVNTPKQPQQSQQRTISQQRPQPQHQPTPQQSYGLPNNGHFQQNHNGRYSSPYAPSNQPSQRPRQSNNTQMPPAHRPAPATTQQEFFGVPTRAHPQGQGLFSTLKQVDQPSPGVVLFAGVARGSCKNCQLSKRKCDEQRPICGRCQSIGKSDCSYQNEHGVLQPATRWAPPTANMIPSQQSQMLVQESPDPSLEKT